jgi:hypothetical protein
MERLALSATAKPFKKYSLDFASTYAYIAYRRKEPTMATAHTEKTKLAQAYRYANLIKNKAKRDYANAWIVYLRNGAEGLEPERGKLSYMAAQAVRLEINAMNLWENLVKET